MNTDHLTPGILDAFLSRHDPKKPVCFCRSTNGLSFYRFKMRGERLLQIEFNELPYRDSDGRLRIDAIFPAPENPKDVAPVVEQFLLKSGDIDSKNFHLFFGGDEDALTFVGTEDFGEWVSINFKQRIYRNDAGGLTVEETLNGVPSKEDFPLSEFISVEEAHKRGLGPKIDFPE